MSLKGKKILVGVTGSIAAYKVAMLVRLLKKEGSQVQIIMTESAKDFITPITLSTLSQNPVLSKFSDSESGKWHNHVELGLQNDLFLVAPASANTIAKAANGICDNLLLATYLSAKCPVYFAPAMDLDMFAHKSTTENLKRLQSFGNKIIDPETGELASGLEGKGRMAEPEVILEEIQKHFKKKSKFKNKKVLITAGPTYEKIDPVRFIGNHSSGKMGFALTKAFCESGARVNLICGPVHLQYDHPNLNRFDIQSAEEMDKLAKKYYSDSDIAIFSAAVSDYRPENKNPQKIKKGISKALDISLIENPDIAYNLGQLKSKTQINVGFALETENIEENARKKLLNKNFDLIVMNSPNKKDSGFGHDTNKISILSKDNKIKSIKLKKKEELAWDILKAIEKLL